MQSRRHCPLLRIAPSVVPHGSRVALTIQSHHEQTTHTNLWDRRPKSPPNASVGHRKNRRRICGRWAARLSGRNARRVESASSSRSKPATRAVFARRPSCPHGNAAFRAESGGFDLAADFLYSIVIPVNLMTFQTRGIGNTSRKLAVLPLGGAIDTVVSSVCAGIDKHLSSSGDLHVTH